MTEGPVLAKPELAVPEAWELARIDFARDLTQEQRLLYQDASPSTVLATAVDAQEAHVAQRSVLVISWSSAVSSSSWAPYNCPSELDFSLESTIADIWQ